MKNNSTIMALSFASLVALLSFFLLHYIPGINALIFYGVLTGSLILILYDRGELARIKELTLLIVSVLLLSLIPFYRTNLFYVFLVFFSLPIIYYLFFTVPKAQLKKLGVIQLLFLPLTLIIVWLTDTIEAIKRFSLNDAKKGLSSRSKQYLIGLVASIPFLILFLLLFSSADAVFFTYFKEYVDVSSFTQYLSKLFEDEALIKFTYRLGMALIMSVYFFAVYHAIFIGKSGWEDINSKMEKLIGKVKSNWSATTLGTFLFPINILFGLFVLIQIRYFFGGEESIVGLGDALGYTFSEYARRGFVELVIVSFTVFLLIGFVQSKVDLKTATNNLWYKMNGFALLLLTMVIGVSALNRLVLLTDYYGLTNLRLFGWVVTVAILILIPIVIYSVHMEKRVHWFNRTYAYMALISMLILVILPTDLIVSRYNIDRFERTGELDVSYLLDLSPEAQVYTSQYLMSDQVPEDTQIFASYYYSEWYKLIQERDYAWQSFNISRWSFENVLEGKFDSSDGQRDLLEQRIIDFFLEYSTSLNRGDYENTFQEYWSGTTSFNEEFELMEMDVSDIEYSAFFPYEELIEDLLEISSQGLDLNILMIPVDIGFSYEGENYICNEQSVVIGLQNGRYVIFESETFKLGIPYYYEPSVYDVARFQFPGEELGNEVLPGKYWSRDCEGVE